MDDIKQAERKAFIRKTALQSFKIVLLGVLLIFVYLIVFACCFAGSEEEQAHNDTATATEKEYFCQVRKMVDDGLILYISDCDTARYVYAKCDYSHLEMRTLYTVVITFTERDLIAREGTYEDYFGEISGYTHVLEKIQSIRLADTDAGEPTFG